MKTKSIALSVVLLITSTRLALGADAINEALKKGLLEEEANHNLDAAIQAYQSVVSQYDDQRKVAATAIFRLGECYRKQGKTNEALIQYARVVSDFGDQTALAKLASDNLRARSVGAPQSRFPGEPPYRPIQYPQFIQLLESDRIVSGRIRYPAAGDGLLEVTGLYSDASQNGKTSEIPFRIKLPRSDGIEKRLLESGKFRTLEDVADGTQRQKELLQQELALVESQLASKQKLAEVGRASSDDLIPLQREILSLKRQIAALENTRPDLLRTVQLPSEEGRNDAPGTDDEAKEIQRLKEIIRNSPDLINSKDEGGYTPLHSAAFRGQLAVARFLLENGADVNARDNGGGSALYRATSQGYKAMAELLLSKGAAVNAKDGRGSTPLHIAAAKGFVALAKTLVGKQADVNAKDENNATPLHWAVEQRFKDIVGLLLANKADPNVSGSPRDGLGQIRSGTPLHIAVRRGRSEDEELVELLLKGGAQVDAKNPSGLTPLQLAVQSDNERIVDALLSKDADVNAKDDYHYTPLHWAIRPGNKDMVESLLANKANVNAKDKAGETPLYTAVRIGDKTIVELLLSRGADVNAQDVGGSTPLHWASRPGNKDVVESLLARKANVNAKDKAGDTPLHTAVRKGDKAIVELLLARGTDVNARNNEDKTPLDLTKPSPVGVPTATLPAPVGRGGAQNAVAPEEIAPLLRKHGAKE